LLLLLLLLLLFLRWRKGPVMGYLPPSRDAPTLMQLSREWLLLLGGKGPRNEPLNDVQRLHLPTLSWKPPLQLCSTAEGAAQRQPGSDTVDFSATAGVVVGGSRDGAYGLQVVPRLEVLLPGPPIPFDAADDAAAAASSGAASQFQQQQFDSRQLLHELGAGGIGGQSVMQLMQRRQQQQQLAAGLLADGAGSSCACGSCCSCLARKAAADARSCCGVAPSSAATAAALMASPSRIVDAAHLSEVHSEIQSEITQSEITPDPAYLLSQHAQHSSGIRAQHISSSIGSTANGSLANGTVGAAARATAAPAGAGAAAAATAPAAAAAGVAGSKKVWQPPQQKPGALLQLLLALAALVLGLLLAYPSMMLQQAAVVDGST
jgi:hypothetical protein